MSAIFGPKDFALCVSNPSNEYHILRHFTKCDPVYTQSLVGNPYWYFHHSSKQFEQGILLPEDIDYALATKGGSFLGGIVGLENPRAVIALMIESLRDQCMHGTLKRVDIPNGRKIIMSLSRPEQVGWKCVCRLDEIDPTLHKSICRVPRSSHFSESDCMINILAGQVREPSFEISFEIHDTGVLPFYFLTAYPLGRDLGPVSFDSIVFLE